MEALWFETALLPDGWADGVAIGIEAGRIASVEERPARPGDARHGIALPGLCNVHSHGFQRGMAGLAERRGGGSEDFWSWRAVMYRFVGLLGPEDVAAIGALAYAEMLESGYTRVGEFHYLHHAPGGERYADPAEMAGRIVEAAETAGIGLTLLPVFYAHAGLGGVPPSEAQARFVTDPESFARLMDAARGKLPADAVLGVAPHSLRAVTPEELAAVLPLAEGGPIHIHAAEQVREVEECRAWSGAAPVAWLLANAGVDRRWCLVHATHMDPAETAALAASGAVAGLCPVTEANLGDGIFPAGDYLGAGGAFGTGSDSNVLIDAAEELRMLEYGQRLQARQRTMLAAEGQSTGRRLFDGALRGGVQALGVAGELKAGARADIVSLAAGHPSLAGRGGDSLLDGWIFAAGRTAVDCVWRGGRKVVGGGRHHRREAIETAYRATMGRLLA